MTTIWKQRDPYIKNMGRAVRRETPDLAEDSDLVH